MGVPTGRSTTSCLVHGPRKLPQNALPHIHLRQNWLLKADATNALTTVFAGFAFTTDSLPNIIFLVALVAGLLLVFIRTSPGIVKTPVFFTSSVATSARVAKALSATDFLISVCVAMASANADFDMATAAVFFPFGAIVGRNRIRGEVAERRQN